MNILVIGNGFIGSEIISSLSAAGHKVTAFSRTFKQDTAARQIIGDILSLESLHECLSHNPEVVIQTAWITQHATYMNSPLNSLYSKFTQDLANHLISSPVRHLIVLGSCAEYGIQVEPTIAGITQVNPQNFYSRQKVQTLQSVKEILRDSKIRMTWARIFYPYGPTQDSNRLIPQMIASIKEEKSFKIFDLNGLRDWISTVDIASAVSWSIDHNLPIEIDIGTSIGYSNSDIYRKLLAIMGKGPDLVDMKANIDESTSMSVVSKESDLFASGWKPTHSLDSGLDWVLKS